MKKNRRNNSRPAAIATAKDTTKAIETRAGVLKEAEDVKKERQAFIFSIWVKRSAQKRLQKKCMKYGQKSMVRVWKKSKL